MEFRFRADDRRPSQYPSSCSNVFEQALTGNKADPFLRVNPNMMTKPSDINEAMRLELELLRCREERMAAEILRQRTLKEEAWREVITLERQLAAERAAQTEGLPFHRNHGGMPFNLVVPVVNPFHGRRPEGQLRSYQSPLPQELVVHDSKPQEKAGKSELILLEKPDPKEFTAKRKIETPSTEAVDKAYQRVVPKNHETEWSCPLCQVAALSEAVFKDHLRGKKHRKKEAALRTQNLSKISERPMKKRKLLKAVEKVGSSGAGQEWRFGDSVKYVKIGGVLNQKTTYTSCSNDNKGEQQVPKHCVEDPKIKPMQEAATDLNSGRDAVLIKAKKFKFWCKVCKVGAYFQSVMDSHLKGKKHITGIRELSLSCETANGITAVASSKATT